MRVTPITEKEAEDAGLWKSGLYDFEVLTATDRLSKAGNDMIELNLKLYDPEGRSFRLFDYLVSNEAMAFKVRHFASATGMLPQYEAGELKGEDCVGKSGRAQVTRQKAKGGYPAKNVIQDYLPVLAGQPLVRSVKNPDMADDEIPF
jgi:hypothetical protein